MPASHVRAAIASAVWATARAANPSSAAGPVRSKVPEASATASSAVSSTGASAEASSVVETPALVVTGTGPPWTNEANSAPALSAWRTGAKPEREGEIAMRW